MQIKFNINVKLDISLCTCGRESFVLMTIFLLEVLFWAPIGFGFQGKKEM